MPLAPSSPRAATGPGFFSSARRFSLPPGPAFDPRGLAGYPVDFRAKAVVPRWPPPELDRQHLLFVDVAQWGLGAYERHLAGEGQQWLAAALACGRHLLRSQGADGGWRHPFPYAHSLPVPAGWISAMAQGEGASLLVRLHRGVGEEGLLDAAARAMPLMEVPSADGGARAEIGGRPLPEEYPTDPPSFVLNGALFALWGLRDTAVAVGDDALRRRFDEGAVTLGDNLHRWDTGWWSRYDLFPHPVVNVASSFYHALHIVQLGATAQLSPHPAFAAVGQRWVRYAASDRHRRHAFARKALFRLAVPRNATLAAWLPWTGTRRRSAVNCA